MTRAYGEVFVQDVHGNILGGVAIDLLDPATNVRISDTVYADASSGTTISLPTVTDATGKLSFYLTTGRTVKARATVAAATFDDVIAVADPTASGGGGGVTAGTLDITVSNGSAAFVSPGLIDMPIGMVVNYSAGVNANGVPQVYPSRTGDIPGLGTPLGIMLTDLSVASNATGTCRVIGPVTGLDTHAFLPGDLIYSGDGGALSASGDCLIGICQVQHASAGIVFVTNFGGISYVNTHTHTRDTDGSILTFLTLPEIASASLPAVGLQEVYADSADHHLKRVDHVGTIIDIEGGGASSQTSTVTTDTSTFEVTWSFDLGHATTAYVSITLIAVVADGETWGSSAGQITADLYNIQQSHDGVLWISIPTIIWYSDLPYDGSQSLPHLGWSATNVTGRYMRGLFHVIDGSSFNTYAGANHPTAQIRVDIEYL